MRKKRYWVLAAVAVLVAVAWVPLVRNSPPPNHGYTLDLARIRAAADSMPGPKPSAVRYEKVMDLKFYEAMLMAGEPWKGTPMPIYSYQVAFPQQTIIVDAGLQLASAQPGFMVMDSDEAAFQRMTEAMDKASQIVITHEHMDHIGGIAVHPRLARLLPALRLTEEQFGNPGGMKPVVLPADVMKDYKPLHYDGMLAIAPGVVLVKAPGHTPGSQLVYVHRADGRELLLIGDVSWRLKNLEQVRERPLFMTAMIGENREQVLGEFQALHELMQAEPRIAIVPGHDAQAVQALTAAGVLQQGFQ